MPSINPIPYDEYREAIIASGIKIVETAGRAPTDHLPRFKEHGVKEGGQEFYIHGDLDTLPFPDREMLPYRQYHSVVAKNDFVTTMITSRGCPYKCTFCKLAFIVTVEPPGFS